VSKDGRRVRLTTDIPTAKILGIAAAAGLVPLNSTMIAVALPAIAEDFGVSTATATTLITLYLVVMLVGQPIAGRITDAVGAKRSVLGALAGLAVFSFGAAFAPSFGLLVVARALQAMCAATLSPGAQSLLRSISGPHEQGRVFGILGSVLGTGAALGPVVGGLLVQSFGWQAIFLVNVPIAAMALLTARRSHVVVSTVEGHEAIADRDERILNRVFVVGFSAQALSTQAQYALLLLTPIVLNARGWEAGSIGIVLSALTIGMIVMGPIGGRAGDERGRRLPATIGLTIASTGIVGLLLAGSSIAPVVLVTALAVFGVGLGLTTPNLMSAALGSVPAARAGAAAGVLSMSRYVGSIGTSLLIAGFVTADGDGTRVVLGVSALCMTLAILVSRGLPGGRPKSARGPSVAAEPSR
jgi:MFS family permease